MDSKKKMKNKVTYQLMGAPQVGGGTIAAATTTTALSIITAVSLFIFVVVYGALIGWTTTQWHGEVGTLRDQLLWRFDTCGHLYGRRQRTADHGRYRFD